jgi:hypothetical protein
LMMIERPSRLVASSAGLSWSSVTFDPADKSRGPGRR